MRSQLLDLVESLTTSDPERLTKGDIEKIRWFIRSDGCTGVPDICVEECIKHDFYYRTGVDFSGRLIRFEQANLLFFRGLWKHYKLLACWRWLGVTLLARPAWDRGHPYRT